MVDHLQPDYLGGLGLVLHGSATFGDALRGFARVFPVVNQHVVLELIEDGAWVRVCFVVPSDVESSTCGIPRSSCSPRC
jgi:hypothetical protein